MKRAWDVEENLPRLLKKKKKKKKKKVDMGWGVSEKLPTEK